MEKLSSKAVCDDDKNTKCIAGKNPTLNLFDICFVWNGEENIVEWWLMTVLVTETIVSEEEDGEIVERDFCCNSQH